MVRMLVFSAALLFLGHAAQAKGFRTQIRCQLYEGYEIAVQNAGSNYYLTLLYGGKAEYRERLKKTHPVKLDKEKGRFDFELQEPGGEDYLVKIAANFDEESSFDEVVHYKIRPRSKSPLSYRLYELAGNGLPLRELGCVR